MATTTVLTMAADWHFLVNPLVPLVAFGLLMAWGWLVSTRLDKDAMYWHLKRREWNLAHLIAGFVGFIVMVFPAVPEPWWPAVSVPVGVLVMLSTILLYWYVRNKAVPEENRYHLSMDSLRAAMQKRQAARASASVSIALIDSTGTSRIPPSRESEMFGAHVAMEEVLSPAFIGRATRIECLPGSNGKYQVGQYIDGVRYRREPLEAPTANAVIDYLKSHAGMEVADKRRRQIGDMAAKQGMETKNLRLRSAGSSQGQSLIIDVDIKKNVNIKPDDLGVLPQQFERLDKVIEDRSGIVLVSASRGGGRTTTLYSLLRRHDAFTRNIRTLELEQLLQLDGVGHTEFKPSEEGTDYATQLRSMLRRDPNIMMVAEVPDARTAQEAAAPGPTGPLIYVGMRADSGLEALATWCKAVGDLKVAAAPLRAVTYQVLLRRLCESCKVPYSPKPEQLKKLGLPPDQIKQLFNASGKIIDRNKEETCTVCAGLGYRGLVGCFEIMTFDDEARDLIAKGDLNALRANLARNKTITLQQAALRKAIEGVTSIDEVIRATKPKSSSSSSKKPRKAPAAAATAEAEAE